MFNVSVLLLDRDDALYVCVVTEVVLLSFVALLLRHWHFTR